MMRLDSSGFFTLEINLLDLMLALLSSLFIELFTLELEFEPLRADSC